MNSIRIKYLISIVSVIFLGLLSRKILTVPLFVGDVLWAIMIFLIIRFIFINKSIFFCGLTSLFLCYSVEISQLYQAEWINSIRSTLPGRLILGQGFLWSDVVAYTVGVSTVSLIEIMILKYIKN